MNITEHLTKIKNNTILDLCQVFRNVHLFVFFVFATTVRAHYCRRYDLLKLRRMQTALNFSLFNLAGNCWLHAPNWWWTPGQAPALSGQCM